MTTSCIAGAADDAPDATRLRFDWPIPSRVRVTETALKRGATAVARYELVITPAPGGGAEIRYASFEPLTLDGQPIGAEPPPELQAAFASLMPRFRVDAAGRLVDVVGLDRLARLHGVSQGSGDAQPELTPESRAMLRATVASYWAAWAGAWAGLELAPGAEIERTSEVSLFGAEIEQTETVRHLGPAPDHEGKIRLRSETVFDDRVTRLVRAALDSARRSHAPAGPPLQENPVVSVKGTAAAETVTDPATLVPVLAVREKVVHATLEDGRTVTSIENHRYEFEWLDPPG